jgi:hypothetical protein
MLAHALLAVIAAHARADQPAQAGLIALTCNEIRRLLVTFSSNPPAPSLAHWRGHDGDDATNTTPEQATTSVRRPLRDARNDLRLEY